VRLISASICNENSHILLTSALGKAIRFPVTDVRVFKGRDSTGVRGMRLAEGDEVVSMAVIDGVDCTVAEARAYLKMRRAMAGEDGADGPETVEIADDDTDAEDTTTISQERYIELSAQEETILTIAENGIGKRTSAFEYRAMRRGGQGVAAMSLSGNSRSGATRIVASFPVDEGDQVMLVTDTGQSIRCGVSGVSVRSRGAGGVWMLRTGDDENVVSVARLVEQSSDVEEELGEAVPDTDAPDAPDTPDET